MAQVLPATGAKQLNPLPSISIKRVEPDMIPHMFPKRRKPGPHIKFYRTHKKQGTAVGAGIILLISGWSYYFLISGHFN